MNKAGQKEQTHEEQLRDTAAEPFYAEIRQDADRASEKVAAMLRCLGEHLFDSELNVNFIKRKTKTRDNSVTITFHLEMGRTLKNYLTDCRMGVAVQLLKNADLKIWQISDLLGFSILGVFSKAFQRWAGKRPRHFRELLIKQSATPEVVIPTPSVPYLTRALAGELSPEEGERLIRHLREIYRLRLEVVA